MSQPRVDFLFFDAGGGHRAAATALEAVAREQGRPWQVRLVDLNDVLVKTDVLKSLTGYGLEDIYNLILEKGWTLGSAQMLPVMQAAIRVFHSQQVRLMREFWQREGAPELAVSVVPNFNRALFQAYRALRTDGAYVNILTDLADYPPHFWIERGQAQYFICGSAKAVEQAKALGHPAERIFATSGMILRPSFYSVKPVDRSAERGRLGLEDTKATALILFGGHGAPVMEKIVERLEPLTERLQVIAMCGHNQSLASKLRARRGRLRLHVEGFTKDVPQFMQIADFMIGKPGPGSISEAIHMGLPVIVERNAWTLPQERYNADWVTEHGVGLVLGSFGEIRGAVERLTADGALQGFRERAARMQNRAVFEIPDILQRILAAHA